MGNFKCKCGLEFDNVKEFQEHIIICPVYRKGMLEELPAHTKKVKKSVKIYTMEEKVDRSKKSDNKGHDADSS